MHSEGADGLFCSSREEEEEEGIEEAAHQSSLASEEDAVAYRLRGGIGYIRVREVRSKGLSFQIWPAAHVLCSYLEESYGPAGMFSNHSSRSSPRNFRVLELGAGTGMVGILCAVLGAHCTITDLPHVIPNIEHNARLNENVIEKSGRHGSVVAKCLRWGEQADVEAVGHGFDLIVASDVVYYDHLFEPLLRTLNWLLIPPSCKMNEGSVGAEDREEITVRDGLSSSTGLQEEDISSFAATPKEAVATPQLCGGVWEEGAPPVVLLAHLRRWKKDSRFFKKAAKLFQTTVVCKHLHDANSRTGVTVYSFSRKKN